MKKIFAVVIISGALLWTQQASAWLPAGVAVVDGTLIAATTVIRKCQSNGVACIGVIESIVSLGKALSYSPTVEGRVNNAIAKNKSKITLFKCPNSNSLYAPEEVSEHCKTVEVVDVEIPKS